MCSAMSRVGTRMMYWICARLAGMLSAVAWPAVRIASFIDQEPPVPVRCSLSALADRYIRITEQLAPGAPPSACEAGIGGSDATNSNDPAASQGTHEFSSEAVPQKGTTQTRL